MPLLELLDKFIKLKVSLQAIAGFFRTQKIFFLKEFLFLTKDSERIIIVNVVSKYYR